MQKAYYKTIDSYGRDKRWHLELLAWIVSKPNDAQAMLREGYLALNNERSVDDFRIIF